MKKFFCIIMLLLLTGCSLEKNVDSKEVILYKNSFVELLNDSNKKFMYKHNIDLDEDVLSLLGTNIGNDEYNLILLSRGDCEICKIQEEEILNNKNFNAYTIDLNNLKDEKILSENFIEEVLSIDLSVVPAILFIDNGVVGSMHLGFIDSYSLENFIDESKEYDMINQEYENITLGEFIQTQQKAKQYIKNLKEVEVEASK